MVLTFGECIYLGQFPDVGVSNSSVYISKPSVDGLPFRIRAVGENPRNVNETILGEMINDSYDDEFMARIRPNVIRNTPGACNIKYSWYRLPMKIWPRWIKLRTCFDKNYDVPGNVNLCHPTSFQVKTLMSYSCTYFRNGNKLCEWYPFYYPFITGCSSKVYNESR